MFSEIKNLFGRGAKTHNHLYLSNHPAANEISEAERLVDQFVDIQEEGGIKSRRFSTDNYLKIKEILDRAVLKCPDDSELLYARASLQYYALQGEDGAKDRDNCLKINPGHFDANISKEHGYSWEGIFQLPGFNDKYTSVPNQIRSGIDAGQMTQVVRDHLHAAIALFVSNSQVDLTGCNRIRWDIKWKSTPYGNIAAHYILLDNGKFLEQFIPHLSSTEPNVNDNYWLLRRLVREAYCIIAVFDGESIIRVERYIFPRSLINVLRQLEKHLIAKGPANSMEEIQQAAQWYMENSDISDLKF